MSETALANFFKNNNLFLLDKISTNRFSTQWSVIDQYKDEFTAEVFDIQNTFKIAVHRKLFFKIQRNLLCFEKSPRFLSQFYAILKSERFLIFVYHSFGKSRLMSSVDRLFKVKQFKLRRALEFSFLCV